MQIHIGYFIALCVLELATLITETLAYRRAIKERDAFGTILELYIVKYGRQTFEVDGETFKVE